MSANWQSMTGFGRAEQQIGPARCVVAIRSVNHKGREIRLQTQPRDPALEHAVEQLIAGRIQRGKLDVRMSIGSAADDAADPFAIQRLRGRLWRLRLELGRTASAGLVERLAVERSDAASPSTERILEVVHTAIDALVESRQREGAGLHDIVTRMRAEFDDLLRRYEQEKQHEQAARAQSLAERLEQLRDAGLAVEDRQRIEQEVAFLLARSDVTEELDRLKLHLDLVDELLETDGPVGRKLDVLAQEIGREVHTLGAKSAWPDCKRLALDIRNLSEQLREQVQNVE